MKKLKIANIGDWEHRGGHLYVAGYSQKDMLDLINEAYRKIHGYTDRPDIQVFSLGEFRTYGSMGCWGNAMDGVSVERGVWWDKGNEFGHPEKVVKRIL